MTAIFVSYAIRDAEFGGRLKEIIETSSAGRYKVVSASLDGLSNEDTFSGIMNSKVVVALISDASRSNTLFELGYAFGLGKRVIAISLGSAPLPSELRDVHHLRMNSLDDEAASRILAIISEVDEASVADDAVRTSFQSKLDNPGKSSNPMQFEAALKSWFEEAGFQVEPAKPHDGGYDLLVKEPATNRLFVVECKRQLANNLVSVDTVRNVLGAIDDAKADGGIIVCTSDFTKSARAYAASVGRPLLLWTTNSFRNWQVPNRSEGN